MIRHVWGVVAATVTAPYITAASMVVVGFASTDNPTPAEALAFVLWGGSMALLFLGIPILFVSALLSAVVRNLERHALPGAILSGALAGSGLMIVLFWNALDSSRAQLNVGCGAVAGMLCGWIYWRIAIGRSDQSA